MSSNTSQRHYLCTRTHTQTHINPYRNTHRKFSILLQFVLTWSSVFTLLFNANNIPTVHSHLLHSYDQAVGLWSLILCRRDYVLLESMVFPPTQLEDEQQLQLQTQDKNVPSITNKKQLTKQKRLECQLCLNPDGTFVLHPPSPFDLQTTNANAVQRLSLKGFWKLR